MKKNELELYIRSIKESNPDLKKIHKYPNNSSVFNDKFNVYTYVPTINSSYLFDNFNRVWELNKVLGITADNGVEFSQHEAISKALGVDIYFAHPYHSWERGLNENTNGLIRQYIPKGKDFAEVSDADIISIQNKLNNRPRKSLGYATPNEVFSELAMKQALI